MREAGSSEARRSTMHVGVVHGVSGIHFVAAADSRAALLKELAGYVRRHAELQLYPDDAAVLKDLLERSEEEVAVRYYFDRVGARWDREWLTSNVVPVARSRTADCRVIPLFQGDARADQRDEEWRG